MSNLSSSTTKESERASHGGFRPPPRNAVPGIDLRPVAATDGPAIVAMFRRCGPESRYARFLAPLSSFPSVHLERILEPARGDEGWVAVPSAEPATLVALGSWSRCGNEAELALLVEDAWQRQGIGSAFVELAAERARAVGVRRFTASVVTGSEHVRRLLRSNLGPLSGRLDGPVDHITIELS